MVFLVYIYRQCMGLYLSLGLPLWRFSHAVESGYFRVLELNWWVETKIQLSYIL